MRFSSAGVTCFRVRTVLYSAGVSISRTSAGLSSSWRLKLPYSAGTGMRRVSGGTATTRFFTVRYSAGTLTRHMISPVRPSTLSIGPRPFFHMVVAGRISWVSSTSL